MSNFIRAMADQFFGESKTLEQVVKKDGLAETRKRLDVMSENIVWEIWRMQRDLWFTEHPEAQKYEGAWPRPDVSINPEVGTQDAVVAVKIGWTRTGFVVNSAFLLKGE